MDPKWQSPDGVRAMLGGVAGADVPEIRLLDLALGVFLFPGQVLLASRASGRWRRPLVLLLMVVAAAGTLLAASSYPGLYHDAVEWSGWFGKLVGEFRIEEESFVWDFPDELPYTTRCQRVRVTFAPTGAPVAPQDDDGRERQGLWITHKKIVLWWLVRPGLFESAAAEPSLGSLDITDMVRELAPVLGTQRLQGEQFRAYAKTVLRYGLPLYVATICFSVALPVLMYVLLFTTMAMIMRRRQMTGGFASVLAVNLVCAVPAVCVACVYAVLDMPALTFSNVFILAFFLYIMLAFSSVRRMLLQD